MTQQLDHILSSYWTTFANGLLTDAIFITDSTFLNAIKWNFSLDFISSCRFIGNIQDISDLEIPTRCEKIVFLLSNSLLNHWKDIQSLLSEPYIQVHVYTSVLHASHMHELQKTQSISMESYESNAYFTDLETQIYQKLRENATKFNIIPRHDFIVKVAHAPLHIALICNQVFMLPGLSHIFPSINGQIDDSMPMKLVESVAGTNSIESNTDISLVASSLVSLLECMGHKDELFALGETSKKVAKNIVSQSSFSLRRNSESNLAVILMDRTMDLETCFLSNDNILDMLYNSNQRNHSSLDVLISPHHLFTNCGATDLNLCLAHSGDTLAKELLQVLTILDYKSALITSRKRIIELLQSELPSIQVPRVLGKITKTQMESLLHEFRNRWDIVQRKGSVLSCLSAVVDGIDSEFSVKNMKLLEIERHLHEVNENEVVQQIQSLLSKVGLEYEIEDVLMLSLYASLLGFNLIGLTLDYKETLTRLGWDSVSSDLWIKTAFTLFYKFQNFQNVSGTKRTGTSLVSEILSNEILQSSHRSTILSHIPYTGTIGSVLSGFNRLLGVDNIQPSQFKNIVLFVIGGITFKEIGQVRRMAPHVLIGSNQFITRKDLYHLLERDC